MSTKRTYTVRELMKKLRHHDKRFELHTDRGKGSHRMIFHPDIKGQEVSYTIPCSRGDKTEVTKVYIAQIIKIFHLPQDLL